MNVRSDVLHGQWTEELRELEGRRKVARQLGNAVYLEKHRAQGGMDARRRIDELIDPGSFRELGILCGKGDYDDASRLVAFKPSAHVLGVARIGGRSAVVISDDFSIRGGSSEAVVAEKWIYADRYAYEYRMPLVRIVHSAGGSVRVVEQSGATKIPGYSLWPGVALLGSVPVVGVALGPVAGLGAIRLCTSHFSVMVRGRSQVFAGGPPVVKQAIGVEISKEALGGASIHEASGVVNNIVDSEEEALAEARRFLSYMPRNCWTLPSRETSTDPTDRTESWLNDAIPRDRRKVFDCRRIIKLIFDEGSIFEIGRYFGGSTVTALARLSGWPVGVITNDPRHQGGAMTKSAATKLERFVDLCDTFRLPIVHLPDQPGTMTGPEAERTGTLTAVLRASAAIEQSSVPWIGIVLRRAFGLAGGMVSPWVGASGTSIPHRFAWPSARWGSIPIEGGVAAAFKAEILGSDDPEERRIEIERRLHEIGSPFRTAERFGVVDIIEPASTRSLLCDWIEDAQLRLQSEPLGIRLRSMR